MVIQNKISRFLAIVDMTAEVKSIVFSKVRTKPTTYSDSWTHERHFLYWHHGVESMKKKTCEQNTKKKYDFLRSKFSEKNFFDHFFWRLADHSTWFRKAPIASNILVPRSSRVLSFMMVKKIRQSSLLHVFTLSQNGSKNEVSRKST
jgi:hypothetical protein